MFFESNRSHRTQLQWQRAEDPHGNPFVAIVLDPIRSQHLSNPQLKAFRAYPPEYSSPIVNQCPDGSVVASEQSRLELWGSCWNRYYELNIEYYMSTTSRSILGDLTSNYLWITNFKRQDPITKIKTLEDVATKTKSDIVLVLLVLLLLQVLVVYYLLLHLLLVDLVVLLEVLRRLLSIRKNYLQRPHSYRP